MAVETDAEMDILLVEDDPADIDLTLLTLRTEKLCKHLSVARDGAEALDLLFRRGPYRGLPLRKPRLILLDLKLPKVDGLEVLREIKSSPEMRSIPVVILTSSNEEKDLAACYQLGVNSYIQKPVDFDEFRQVVRQLGLYWLLVNRPLAGELVRCGVARG